MSLAMEWGPESVSESAPSLWMHLMKPAVCRGDARVHFYGSFELKNQEWPVEPVEEEWTEGDVEKAPVGQISQPLEIPALSNHSGRYVCLQGESEGTSVCERETEEAMLLTVL